MEDIVALLFGAAIVFFFSYERFNRSTDETGQQLVRLVSLLSPDKMRSRRVVANAYFFYTATFLVIYLFLCAYAQFIPLLGGPDIAIGAGKLPVLQGDAATNATTGFTSVTREEVTDAALIQPLSNSADPAADSREFNIGISAATSLAVALMIVGLAPAFPILQSFEAWMRGAAHRLAGIPTRVLSIRDELRGESLNISPPEGKIVPEHPLLIPRGDWERMMRYRSEAKALDSPEDFANDMELIFAVSAWILERKLILSNFQGRERFVRLERELNQRTELLIEALDEKTGYGQKTSSEYQPSASGGAKPASGAQPQVTEQTKISAQPEDDTQTESGEQAEGGGQIENSAKAAGSAETNGNALPESAAPFDKGRITTWNRLAKQADDLADDMCLLLALYVEHEIINPALFEGLPKSAPGPWQPIVAQSTGSLSAIGQGDISPPAQQFVTLPADEQNTSQSAAGQGGASFQRRQALQKLKEFLKGYAGDQTFSLRLHSNAMVVGLWAFFVTLAVTMIWSQYPGAMETMLKDERDTGAYRRLGTYTLVAFIAYSIPMIVALAVRDGSQHLRRWRNMSEASWTEFLPQAALIAVISWSLATAVMLGSAFWSGGIDTGWDLSRLRLLSTLGSSFAYNSPTALRGVLLALIVVVLLDAREIASRSQSNRPTQFHSIVWGLSAAFLMGVLGGLTRYMTSWAGALDVDVPRQGLDAIDRGLIAYAALYSAILGFCVVFSISEVLINQRRSRWRIFRRVGAVR